MYLDAKEAGLLLSPPGSAFVHLRLILLFISNKGFSGEGWILLVPLWVQKSNRDKDSWDSAFFPWPR